MIVDEADVLRDEGEAYGARLREAGVAVTTVRYAGITHDFLMLNPLSETPRPAPPSRRRSPSCERRCTKEAEAGRYAARVLARRVVLAGWETSRRLCETRRTGAAGAPGGSPGSSHVASSRRRTFP